MSKDANRHFSFTPRTDLACEAGRPMGDSRSRTVQIGASPVTVTRARETDGGRFVTVSCGSLTEREEDIEELARLLSSELAALASCMLPKSPQNRNIHCRKRRKSAKSAPKAEKKRSKSFFF